MGHDVHSCLTLLTVQVIVEDMFSKQANVIGTHKQPINNSPYSTLTIQVGKIIQICHEEVTIMISSSIKAKSIKITKVIDKKDLHLREYHLKVFNSKGRFYHLYQA